MYSLPWTDPRQWSSLDGDISFQSRFAIFVEIIWQGLGSKLVGHALSGSQTFVDSMGKVLWNKWPWLGSEQVVCFVSFNLWVSNSLIHAGHCHVTVSCHGYFLSAAQVLPWVQMNGKHQELFQHRWPWSWSQKSKLCHSSRVMGSCLNKWKGRKRKIRRRKKKKNRKRRRKRNTTKIRKQPTDNAQSELSMGRGWQKNAVKSMRINVNQCEDEESIMIESCKLLITEQMKLH